MIHTVCSVLLQLGINWFYPDPTGLLHWHWGNHAPVLVKQPWRIWVNRSTLIMSHNITINKQITTTLYAFSMGYTVQFAYNRAISMAKCKTAVSPLLMHWRYGIMHELPWITIFGSLVIRFANDFHESWSHKWKSVANCITSDPKIIIHGNECIILFLTSYFMSWTQNSAKTITDRWDFAIVTKDGLFWLSIVTSPQLICDVMRT